MKKIIAFLSVITIAVACNKDDSEPDKIDIPAEFQVLTTQNWIFYANYDTAYTYYDTVHLVEGIPVAPVTGKTVPLIANPCGQNTVYRFRDDGKFTLQDCNLNSGVLGSWSVKENPAANNKEMVYFTATNGNMLTPFSDTPIPAGQGAFLNGLTITGNTELKVYTASGRFYGVRLNDSTGVGGADFTITNRVFKNQ